MRVHASHMNSYGSLGGTQAAALNAARAEELRRKLAAATTGLDSTVTAESAWMINAWGGQGSSQSSPQDAQPQQDTTPGQQTLLSSQPPIQPLTHADGLAPPPATSRDEAPRIPLAANISYWA